MGTAFDYLLRFELQRRVPHAIATRWIAEQSPDVIWRKDENVTVGRHMLIGIPPEEHIHPELLAADVRKVVAAAKSGVNSYSRKQSVTDADRVEVAAHALRLGKIDSVFRANQLDPQYARVAAEDVQDLLALLSAVPFKELIQSGPLLLNPTFGETSHLVGGADADLITGDLLVDLKTTKKGEVEAPHLDQLLGYFLLARRQRSIDPSFPELNRVALYFCRHAHLMTIDTSTWTTNQKFAGVEEWFFRHADRVYGMSK